MNAYGVSITTKVSDHQYDIEIIGQGQIYLKSVLWFTERNLYLLLSKWITDYNCHINW